MKQLSYRERTDWLQLIRTPQIGPMTFFQLLERYGSAAAALDALPGHARKAKRKGAFVAPARQLIEEEIANAERRGANLIAVADENYPAMLRTIPAAPPLIFARGDEKLFQQPAISIVGARNASGVGLKFCRTISHELGEAGYVVVSGLARGIDGAAHAAALESGTIAVVAGGVDVIYPPEHDELTANIVRQGALISEQPMGHSPTNRDFPRRNRLISGLALGVVVIEAAEKSGTLVTAEYAAEQNREVFAVPGSPLDPRSAGPNNLIRQGATLIRGTADIIEALPNNPGALLQNRAVTRRMEEDSEPPYAANFDTKDLQSQILELLSYTPLHRDEIFRECDAPPNHIAEALLDLVLDGKADELPGGAYTLAAPDL